VRPALGAPTDEPTVRTNRSSSRSAIKQWSINPYQVNES
jgi:hypothetical protein